MRLVTIVISLAIIAIPAVSYAVSDRVLESFEIGGGMPYGLAYDGSYFYITEYLDKSFHVVDPTDGSIVDTIPLNPEPPEGTILNGATFDGTSLWILSKGAGKKMYVVDPATGNVLNTVPLPPPFSGSDGNAKDITWDGTYLYVSNGQPGYTYLGSIDPATGSLVTSWVSWAKRPEGLAYTDHDGADYLFNSGNMDGWTFLYDTVGNRYEEEEFKLNIEGPSWWGGMTFAGSDTDLWVFHGETSTLYHLEIEWRGHEFVGVVPASLGYIKSVYR